VLPLPGAGLGGRTDGLSNRPFSPAFNHSDLGVFVSPWQKPRFIRGFN
jgi:hypothetical protein